jgi:hypothetical protein
MLIYKITSTITNLSYIGQTSQSLRRRWYEHCYKALKEKNNYFHNAIRKYGKEKS